MQVSDVFQKYAGSVEDGDFSLLDLEVLLAFVIGESREFLLAHGEAEVGDDDLQIFEGYLKRLVAGESVAYITGSKEFFGLDFFVDERVLVPRPESEAIVEMGLEYLDGANVARPRILDVGTGSGNLPIALAVALRARKLEPEIDAVDVSADALEVAQINIEQHGVEDSVHLIEGDLLEAFDEGQRYDLIVANLPYIGREKNRFVEKNVEKFEPEVALFGGNDGLELYRKMFLQMREKGIEFGLFLGEFGFAQAEPMMELLREYFADREFQLVKDLAAIERIFRVA